MGGEKRTREEGNKRFLTNSLNGGKREARGRDVQKKKSERAGRTSEALGELCTARARRKEKNVGWGREREFIWAGTSVGVTSQKDRPIPLRMSLWRQGRE